MYEIKICYRALQIIQEEEYLDAADIDEIKIQKRHSVGKPTHFPISFFDTFDNIFIKGKKVSKHHQTPASRQKRQNMQSNFMTFNTTLTSIEDILNLYDPGVNSQILKGTECPGAWAWRVRY